MAFTSYKLDKKTYKHVSVENVFISYSLCLRVSMAPIQKLGVSLQCYSVFMCFSVFTRAHLVCQDKPSQ